MIKTRCHECNQLLQKSLHDRCLYCGANIPIELCCSDEEKKKLIKIRNTYNKKHVKENNKIRNDEPDIDFTWDNFFDGFGE